MTAIWVLLFASFILALSGLYGAWSGRRAREKAIKYLDVAAAHHEEASKAIEEALDWHRKCKEIEAEAQSLHDSITRRIEEYQALHEAWEKARQALAEPSKSEGETP